MSHLSPRERKNQYFALFFFLAGCCIVALLLFTVGLITHRTTSGVGPV